MIADLLTELASAPQLPGALCRGHAPEWDEPEAADDPDDTAERIEFAVSACCRCPALAPCAAWFDGLPATRRPGGVVAGRIGSEQRGQSRAAQ